MSKENVWFISVHHLLTYDVWALTELVGYKGRQRVHVDPAKLSMQVAHTLEVRVELSGEVNPVYGEGADGNIPEEECGCALYVKDPAPSHPGLPKVPLMWQPGRSEERFNHHLKGLRHNGR